MLGRTRFAGERSGASRIRLMVYLLTALTLLAVPTIGGAAEGDDPCGEEPGHTSELCAYGPAGCVAVGLYVHVEPNAALPTGATVQLSRSQANAYGWGGFGYSHSDAHQAQASLPGTLGDGNVESSCNAYSADGFNVAWGDADATNLNLDLGPNYALPVVLSADILHEYGWSMGGAGGNSANLANLYACVVVCVGPLASSVPANTMIAIGTSELWLNEQKVGLAGFCPVYWGDAARLIVRDPFGNTLAQVIISWVSTSTCP